MRNKFIALLRQNAARRSAGGKIIWLGAGVAILAVLAAGGYLIQRMPMGPGVHMVATDPMGMRGEIAGRARVRDVVVWRDKTGNIYRARVDRARFARFLEKQHEAVRAAQRESRDAVAASIPAAIEPVFAAVAARVPPYADWYYDYTTKYVLMGHAFFPALDHIARRATASATAGKKMVDDIAAHLIAYLEEQYAERVLQPSTTEARLQARFDQSYDSIRAQWTRLMLQEHEAMGGFIAKEAGAAEPLSADEARKLGLDWDGLSPGATTQHEDIVVLRSFRRGLLKLMLKVPRATAARSLEADNDDTTLASPDEIAHVILNLFGKVVDPVISEMGNFVTAILAGGVASGTASGIMGTPGAVATGVASTVPIGAAIGLATAITAELLSNRLEESLTRGEFEQNLRDTVDATRKEIVTKMVEVLDQHVDAWFDDIVKPIPLR